MAKGGKREGAGRPCTEPKIRISFRLPAELVEWLRSQPNQTEAAIAALKEYRESQSVSIQDGNI